MQKIEYKDFLRKPKIVPQKMGLFVLYDERQPLFVKSTENLQKFVSFYCDKDNEDAGIQELVKQIHHIEYIEKEALIEALVEEILYINKYNPPFNKIIKPWYKYVYLGVNFENPPYFKVCDDTVELGYTYYLGPFRSAFVVNDMLDVFADLFKMPRCAGELPETKIGDFRYESQTTGQSAKYDGCERLHEELCLGFCQNKLGEALPKMINRMLMIPNKELINKLNDEREAMRNDLMFEKADALLVQIDLLKRYYKHVLFFYTSQFIDGEFKVGKYELKVQDGMIDGLDGDSLSCSSKFYGGEGSSYHGEQSDSNIPIRKSGELLAYEKSEFDHRWIVFNFLYNTQIEYIEQLFMENVVELQKEIFSESKN